MPLTPLDRMPKEWAYDVLLVPLLARFKVPRDLVVKTGCLRFVMLDHHSLYLHYP
jgi:hypothetical protein